MGPQRLSVLALVLVIVIVAIAMAVLRELTPLLASFIFTITVFILLCATLFAWLNPSPALQGFALFGWASLLLSFGPLANGLPVPESLGTVALQLVHAALKYPPPPVGHVESRVIATRLTVQTPDGLFLSTLAYVQIGHCFMSLAAGVVGSVVGRVYASRIRPREPEGE